MWEGNLLVLLVLIAGHTTVWVTIVNRTHSLPVSHELLHRWRRAHDLAVVLFPILLMWRVGLSGPSVLRGGSWELLALPWRVYLGVCLAGVIGLCWSMLRWNFRPVPKQLQSTNVTRHNIAERLGRKPCGEGPHQRMLKVPGNQAFLVEVTERTFALDRLPQAWDGVSMLHLTDWHLVGTLSREYFEEVCKICQETKPDLMVFTGDLLDRQELQSWLPSTLGTLTAPLGCLFILGNHDWNLDPEPIRNQLVELGWQDVSRITTKVERNGTPITIAGYERPWMGGIPDWDDDDEFRLLLSHTPDNLPWAKLQQVDLMLSGHNHGGQVILPVIGPVYSPSKYGVKYAGGVFYESPTLLHVGRGLSGAHPLRINCPPEVTLIRLQRGS